MSRSLLHKTKLQAFRDWCEVKGIPVRPGRGDYQVLQVQAKPPDWFSIYERHHMPEHFTVDRRLESLVYRFIKDTRTPNDPLPLQCEDDLPGDPHNPPWS